LSGCHPSSLPPEMHSSPMLRHSWKRSSRVIPFTSGASASAAACAAAAAAAASGAAISALQASRETSRWGSGRVKQLLRWLLGWRSQETQTAGGVLAAVCPSMGRNWI
jgi:hypothetical protein